MTPKSTSGDSTLTAALAAVNMSGFQKKCWNLIGAAKNPWGFRPEYPMDGYFLDFYSEVHRVAIEADGPLHALPARRKHDRVREAHFLKKGICTLHLKPADFVKYSSHSLIEYIQEFMASAGDDSQSRTPELL